MDIKTDRLIKPIFRIPLLFKPNYKDGPAFLF